uniref:ARAD1B04884p n=1 Tax=Blastobotrys adeninivorans TaxID=409370 RepID=A0A060TB18_BLAAD
MKYGEELTLRSVPEWKTHNIDYNEIKTLIKRATSSKATGQEVEKLLHELFSEYESVSMFVRLKVGEIDFRIEECRKLATAIAEKDYKKRSNASQSSAHISKSRQAYVLRLHRDLDRVTQDLRSLSRFISAQRTGFRKLLKKYKKWSQSGELSTRFLPTLESPNSFTNLDLTSRFLDVYALLDASNSNKGASTTASSTAANPAQFDTQMTMAPNCNAVFWVHPDNVMELHVALLQHMSLFPDSDSTDDHTDAVYLDDKRFKAIQQEREPGSLRWVRPGSANNTDPKDMMLCAPTGGLRQFAAGPISAEVAQKVLDSSITHEPLPEDVDGDAKLALSWVQNRNAVPVAQLTAKRTRFVSGASSDSGTKDKAWALIDSNVTLTASGAKTALQKRSKFSPRADPEDLYKFPHSLLEIRWSGPTKPQWVTDLEESSHLVKHITDFSVYAHAVAIFHASALQVLPWWLSLLDSNVDIRGAPGVTTTPTVSRRQSKQKVDDSRPANQAQGQGGHGNGILLNDTGATNVPALDSAGSTTHSEAEAESYGSSKKVTPTGSVSKAATKSQFSKPVVRYWNEFDDPEDGDPGFFIDANQGVHDGGEDDQGLFSTEKVDDLVRVTDHFVRGISKIGNRLGLSIRGQNGSRYPPLLASDSDDEDRSDWYGTTTNDENDETDIDGLSRFRTRYRQRYETLADDEADDPYYDERALRNRRNSILTFLYSTCFLVSAFILGVLFGVITGEEMAFMSFAVVVFIIIGLVFALLIDMLGICLFLLRDMPDWLHQTIVFSIFFSIVCFDVGALAWLFS